ncbi:MAG: hypothetical protein HYX92_09420 [Chloroflexi bacterium]|nr:hypothetical protein [Chloroflexota bacterium]
MTEVAVKFFRDPRDGQKALALLEMGGFKDDEIGVLTSGRGKESPEIAGVGPVEASGPVRGALQAGSDPAAVLASLWGISEETARYYLFGASTGSMVISVHADKSRCDQARQIMRSVGSTILTEQCPITVSSPGFVMAERMTSTNSSDSKLSGDFRKY